MIFNLHVTHNATGIEQAARSFRSLIDLGIKHQGSYYLTYHRYARRDQLAFDQRGLPVVDLPPVTRQAADPRAHVVHRFAAPNSELPSLRMSPPMMYRSFQSISMPPR